MDAKSGRVLYLQEFFRGKVVFGFYMLRCRALEKIEKEELQCGLEMYLDSENWLKCSIEYENEE